jgi:hypothetical protein
MVKQHLASVINFEDCNNSIASREGDIEKRNGVARVDFHAAPCLQILPLTSNRICSINVGVGVGSSAIYLAIQESRC